MREIATEAIGWASSLILLATIVRQVYKQWRERSSEGVSRWLFIGQTAASVGFSIYSYLLGSWVFLFTNLAMLASALVGEAIFKRNKARATAPP
ncbi:MAG: small rane protein [Betaproteobacteria bacterium]|nr:small rane protein [Betaproteobacteria bacterium]